MFFWSKKYFLPRLPQFSFDPRTTFSACAAVFFWSYNHFFPCVPQCLLIQEPRTSQCPFVQDLLFTIRVTPSCSFIQKLLFNAYVAVFLWSKNYFLPRTPQCSFVQELLFYHVCHSTVFFCSRTTFLPPVPQSSFVQEIFYHASVGILLFKNYYSNISRKALV